MSTILDFKPYRRLLYNNTNYYLLSDPGEQTKIQMVTKMEVGKLIKIDKLGRWIVQADNPDIETLKYVIIDNETPVNFTISDEGFANGCDVIVVPNPFIPPDQPGTKKVKQAIEVNFNATENNNYTITPTDPDTQLMEKVNLSVGVKKNFYITKDEVPPELQLIIIDNPVEEEGGEIIHKKSIEKEVTITTNGDTTVTPDNNEVYKIVKIHTMVPQSITIDPSVIPEDKTVIVVENEEGDDPQSEIISKEWEHKEIEITENGESVIEASNGKVLRDVTITTNVPQEVTIESSETGRKPGYDIIYVPYLDEEGHIDPTHVSDPVFKKGVEKTRTITTNHSTTEIVSDSNEMLKKVIVNVEVPQTQEYHFDDGNIVEGHDTIIIPKDEDDTSPPSIRSVNWEVVDKEFNANTEHYEITPTSEEHILQKVNVKVNVPIQPKQLTFTNNGLVVIEPDEAYQALSRVTLSIQVPKEARLEPLVIHDLKERRKRIISLPDLDGFNEVLIENVPSTIFTEGREIKVHRWESNGISFIDGVAILNSTASNALIPCNFNYAETDFVYAFGPGQLTKFDEEESGYDPEYPIMLYQEKNQSHSGFNHENIYAVYYQYKNETGNKVGTLALWLLSTTEDMSPTSSTTSADSYMFKLTEHEGEIYYLKGLQGCIKGSTPTFNAASIGSAYANPATQDFHLVPKGQIMAASFRVMSERGDSEPPCLDNDTVITFGPNVKYNLRGDQSISYNSYLENTYFGRLQLKGSINYFDIYEIAKCPFDISKEFNIQ